MFCSGAAAISLKERFAAARHYRCQKNLTLPQHQHPGVRARAIGEISRQYHDHIDVINWLFGLAYRDQEASVRIASFRAIARARLRRDEVLLLLWDKVGYDEAATVREAALEELLRISDDSDVRLMLIELTMDKAGMVRRRALTELFERWPDDNDVLAIAKRCVGDEDSEVREAAVHWLGFLEENDPALTTMIKDRASADTDPEVRRSAIWALSSEKSGMRR